MVIVIGQPCSCPRQIGLLWPASAAWDRGQDGERGLGGGGGHMGRTSLGRLSASNRPPGDKKGTGQIGTHAKSLARQPIWTNARLKSIAATAADCPPSPNVLSGFLHSFSTLAYSVLLPHRPARRAARLENEEESATCRDCCRSSTRQQTTSPGRYYAGVPWRLRPGTRRLTDWGYASHPERGHNPVSRWVTLHSGRLIPPSAFFPGAANVASLYAQPVSRCRAPYSIKRHWVRLEAVSPFSTPRYEHHRQMLTPGCDRIIRVGGKRVGDIVLTAAIVWCGK